MPMSSRKEPPTTAVVIGVVVIAALIAELEIVALLQGKDGAMLLSVFMLLAGLAGALLGAKIRNWWR